MCFPASGPADRKAINEALSQLDSATAAVVSAAAKAAATTGADDCLSPEVKAEAAKLLQSVKLEASQQAADCRALCVVTADKADAGAASREQQQQQQPQQEQEPQQRSKQELAKELYGDFNLQLGPISRKMFAAQNKLLALIKTIKKQRAAYLTQEPDAN